MMNHGFVMLEEIIEVVIPAGVRKIDIVANYPGGNPLVAGALDKISRHLSGQHAFCRPGLNIISPYDGLLYISLGMLLPGIQEDLVLQKTEIAPDREQIVSRENAIRRRAFYCLQDAIEKFRGLHAKNGGLKKIHGFTSALRGSAADSRRGRGE